MNKQNKQKKVGFSLLITSLAIEETSIMDQLELPAELTFSLPINSNFFLWQAFHTDLRHPGKNPAACMKYVEQKSQWLSQKYSTVMIEKQHGLILTSASSDFIVRDICLALLSGLDEDRVLEFFKPIFDSIDYIVFIDRRLSSKSVKESHCFLGKTNMEAIRSKMLHLSKKMGWKVIALQNRKLQEEDIKQIKALCEQR